MDVNQCKFDHLDKSPNAPVKIFREPDAEESPQKPPVKVMKLNMDNLANANAQVKRVLNYNYSRVQSHSNSRIKEPEDESQIIRKKWLEGLEKFGVRSVSREVSGKNMYKDSSDKEIQQLNSRIRNLIRENSELKAQIETNGKHIRAVASKEKSFTTKALGVGEFLNSSMLEVTFKPQQNLEDSIKKHKRFPREIFRLPKSRTPKKDPNQYTPSRIIAE